MEYSPPFEFVTKSRRNAHRIVASAEAELALISPIDRQEAWDIYFDQEIEPRFSNLDRASDYLQGIGRLLSVQEFWNRGGNVSHPLASVPLDIGGNAFVHSAKFTYCQLERQLQEDLGLNRRQEPVKLSAFGFVTKTLQRRPASAAEGFADYLTFKINNLYARYPGFWLRPVADFLLPLTDTSQTKLAQVRLGVAFGLSLADSAYGKERRQRNQDQQRQLNKAFKAIQREYEHLFYELEDGEEEE